MNNNRDIHSERILILDFGSQYTQLIARKIREIGVYCEVHPYNYSDAAVREFEPSGIILSGGPESVMAAQPPQAPQQVFNQGCPVLGICYGLQTMAQQLGGRVAADQDREFGQAQIVLHNHSYLFEKIEDAVSATGEALLDVWMSHGDRVSEMPAGFKIIAATPAAPIAAMADETRHFYGLQFHPEVTHTRQGVRILERFVRNICGCRGLWTTNNIAAEMLVKIREKVGKERVILGLSGGVDSSVVAALLQQAIGDQLTCVFVDHGLLRLGDVDRVMINIGQHLGVKIVHVNAADRFFKALAGVEDPEQKRKIIGGLFVEVFEEEAAKIADAKWLAQGTIYSDVIESAGSNAAHLIKSHHNVGGLPETMTLKLLEPLRELFKDEVRRLGVELGLPHAMVQCHPFPGPGLAVRILGSVSAAQADLLRLADQIFIEELHAHDLYHKVSQAFAVLLPVKSVAVMGDARYHEPVVALRAVVTTDFMTAHWAQLPYDFLGLVSTRIINETKGVSRVVYDISNKPPATIEWE